jgi:glycosyltransferase involved in cell wall biosynthesis
MSDISMLLVAYNEPNLLSKCLHSIHHLDGISDLIIIDNHSYIDPITPNQDLIASLSKKMSVSVESTGEDKPLAALYNLGLSQSKQDILLICDCDVEFITQNTVQACLDAFDQNPSIAVQGFLAEHDDPNRVYTGFPFFLNFDLFLNGVPVSTKKSALQHATPQKFPSILRSCFCVRKQDLRFNESHWYGCDLLDYLLSVLLRKQTIHLNTQVTFRHLKSNWKKRRQEKSIAWKPREAASYVAFMKRLVWHPVLLFSLLSDKRR